VQPNTLRGNMQHVLTARALIDALATQGISVAQSTASKQTEATQRWKIRLRVEDSAQEIPTKIEFSRRGLDPGVSLESVDPELLRRYRLPPILVQRYLPEAAFRQKIEALAYRKQTQARDVFDLNLLLDTGAGKEPLPQPPRALPSQSSGERHERRLRRIRRPGVGVPGGALSGPLSGATCLGTDPEASYTSARCATTMTQIEALRRLRELKTAGFETRDAAALFGTTIANTHMILRRLAAADFIVHIARGSWGLVERVSRFSLPQMIAAPYLAYVSPAVRAVSPRLDRAGPGSGVRRDAGSHPALQHPSGHGLVASPPGRSVPRLRTAREGRQPDSDTREGTVRSAVPGARPLAFICQMAGIGDSERVSLD
jgi:hypothetical protein